MENIAKGINSFKKGLKDEDVDSIEAKAEAVEIVEDEKSKDA